MPLRKLLVLSQVESCEIDTAMGDAIQDNKLLHIEQNRLKTFEGHNFNMDSLILARAGFYYTNKDSILECCACHLQIDAVTLDPNEDIIALHKKKKAECTFAQNLSRSKKFASYDSLRFERERLETFIEWPVEWLKPEDLARDGFYYLRTADHCACVFCRGIVGAWEVGDTPRGEHQRHFPHCPFIRGQPVGNIPLTHGELLSKLSPSNPQAADGDTRGLDANRQAKELDANRQARGLDANRRTRGIDVCGTPSPRLMAGSYAECHGPPKKPGISLEGMGLPQHTGPKRKDYLTCESRLASFIKWPERVKQKPKELAEAGFFYCGLSDHVRCFHCGNGLRNWESDDAPWNEHARWYPECNFVLLTKGQEFIDKVRREKPPYIRSQPTDKTSKSNTASTSPLTTTLISENELNPLMELDIIRAVISMGFPQDKVRAALRRKLEQTGLPFFGLEPCIEAVLQYMEEETRQALNQASSQEIENEATAQQAAKMQSLGPENRNRPTTSSASSSASTSTNSTPSAVTSSSPLVTSAASTSAANTLASIPTASASSSAVSASASSSASDREHPEASINNSLTVSPALTTTHEEMETEENTAAETLAQPMDVITEADEIMGIAEVALKPPISGPSSLDQIEMKIEQASGEKMLENPSTSGLEKNAPQSSQELAEELERIRDIRMCKVCMDAEMDVVFLPCQHMVTCSSCALALAQCPICRVDIKYTIKPILS
nr:death-associated inhibitor of apoptosis 1-like [Procambarus clarkii]XP_045612279.1 death-associated inhibitor of apoptosis 1-like [Procambarus clarkii]XP_045612280.1 death-associated inhibitor of apoptosis 1-like [Procambarus clarkii]XP_045612281.1 death-associated inhibitor of apoptosis 1-like [Procambarus clarkii]XP_045612282.1 death-associated inhibitor of apoptosis 1-like [Procambarus clarkii]XP_045612283.1 death-associated inhibitor of apoptosis 1-like [Procambarus clarkii]XP_04561228